MWSTAKQFMWMHNPATLEFRGDRSWSVCSACRPAVRLLVRLSVCLSTVSSMCVSFPLAVSVVVSPSHVSISLYLFFSVPMSLLLCLSVRLYICPCVSPSLSGCLFVSVSVRVSLLLPVSRSLCLSLSTTPVIPVFRKAHLEQSKLKQSLPAISHLEMPFTSLTPVCQSLCLCTCMALGMTS